VSEHMDFNELNCVGFTQFGTMTEMKILPGEKFELFVFASILLNNRPLSFKDWEKQNIKGSTKKYYLEHFMESDARERLEAAFNSGATMILVAQLMVNNE